MRQRVAVKTDATGGFEHNSSVVGVFRHFFVRDDSKVRALLVGSDGRIVFDHEASWVVIRWLT